MDVLAVYLDFVVRLFIKLRCAFRTLLLVDPWSGRRSTVRVQMALTNTSGEVGIP